MQLQPYVEPTEREATWTFPDDGTGFSFPAIKAKDNRADTPNVVRLWYEDDAVGLFAEARNDDPRSEASTTVRRRERQLDDEVTELSGDTPEKMLGGAQGACGEEAGGQLHSHRVRNGARGCSSPAQVGECGLVDYERSGKRFTGGITAKEVDFGPGGETTITCAACCAGLQDRDEREGGMACRQIAASWRTSWRAPCGRNRDRASTTRGRPCAPCPGGTVNVLLRGADEPTPCAKLSGVSAKAGDIALVLMLPSGGIVLGTIG